MRRSGVFKKKNIENTIYDILKSKAISRIYVYLLKKNGAKTEDIIKGTKLHPSTVRETLSKMYDKKLIQRKKIKNDSIGKNPFIYYPIPPIELLRRYSNEIEDRLNQLASIALSKEKNKRKKFVKIRIIEGVDQI